MATAKKTPAKPAAKAAKPADKAPGTAVATRNSGAVVSVKEMMKAQLAKLADKTQPATGNAIRVTQDKQFALPDGTKTREPMRVVILDFCSANEFYPGAFDKDNISPPACIAIGDNPARLIPSDNSPEKQADTCVECPNNIFGSAGNGKACKNSRRVALLPPDAGPDDAIWTLKVSPTALKAFDGYVNGLASRLQVAPFQVVTTVSFDEAKDYPSLTFGDPEVLDEDVAAGFAARIAEADPLLRAEPDFSTYGQEPARKPTPARKAAPVKVPPKAAARAPATARR